MRLSPTQYRLLCNYIDRAFRRQPDGRYLLIPGYSYGIRDRFYGERQLPVVLQL
ncbi:MAG: DUF2459 domain-containing protein [Calditrichae bacterium]|nr:DUF2459 domain-containing protein [Calditrichia bacterium]